MNEEKTINLSNSSIDYFETSKLVERRIIQNKKEMNVIIGNKTIKIRNKDVKYIYRLSSLIYEEGIIFVYKKHKETNEANLLISENNPNNINNSFDLKNINSFKNENRFLYVTFFFLCLCLFFHIVSYVYNPNVSRFII